MKFPSIRFVYFLGFIIIAVLLGTTFYLEHEGINPCPLCIIQRGIIVTLGVLFFLGAIFRLKTVGRIFLGLLASIVSILGIIFSSRQVWLQYFSNGEGGSCEAGLQYLFQVMPWYDALKKIFEGGADCSQVGWKFLSLSLAEWSLIWFVIFLLVSVIQMFRRHA